MEFNEYWNLLILKNPKLNADVIKVKQSGLKAMLEQAYRKGFESLYDEPKEDPKSNRNSEYDPDAVDKLKNLFGMK